MTSSDLFQMIGFAAGAIFFIDGWGPSDKGVSFLESRRFRGLSVIITGGIIAPILDYFNKDEKATYFLRYLEGTIWGWLVVFMACIFILMVWKYTKYIKYKWLHVIGDFLYGILDLVYLGIADNPYMDTQRKRDVKIAEAKADHDVKEYIKELEKEKDKPMDRSEKSKEITSKIAEEVSSVKTADNYTFEDWYYKALAEYDKKEYEKTIAYMKNALEKKSQKSLEPGAHLYMGLAYHFSESYEKAIAQYDIMIEKYPQYSGLNMAYYNKAVAFEKLDKNELALEEYKKSSLLVENYLSVWYNWGNTLCAIAIKSNNEKLFEEAFEKYERAVKINPKFEDTWYNWGFYLNKLAALKQDNYLCKKAIEKMLEVDKLNVGSVDLELAQLNAIILDTEQSLKFLERGLNSKKILKSREEIEKDEYFKDMISLSNFKEILDKYFPPTI